MRLSLLFKLVTAFWVLRAASGPHRASQDLRYTKDPVEICGSHGLSICGDIECAAININYISNIQYIQDRSE